MNTLDFLNANKSSGKSTFVEQAQYLKDNWEWLKYSYAISIKVRRRMAETGITQKQLADEMGCTQQHISVLLNGRVNMTLETLAKLEKALNINLLGQLLDSFEQDCQTGYLNDSGVFNVATTKRTSPLVDGYTPRQKKGPKK